MRRIALALGLALFATASSAQEASLRFSSPVLTIDREALFQQSNYALQLRESLEQESASLVAENRQIEAELVEEEKQLTEDRKTLDQVIFLEKAKAFDEKVVALRSGQDEKTRNLIARREAQEQEFYQVALPILAQIIRERGAVVVLETRDVFLSADQIDITQEAIARIDAQFMGQPDTSGTDD